MKFFLYAIVIITFLDTFVQFPIMSPFAQELGASPLVIGYVVGMYSMTNLFGNMFAGKWSDYYGAKIVLVVGMVTTIIIMIVYIFVETPAQLVTARALHGFTSGLMVPSIFTMVSSRVRGVGQGRNMAYTGAAVGLAAVIGPAMGGIVTAKFGIQWVFVIVAVLLLLGVVYVIWKFPQDAHQHKDHSIAKEKSRPWGPIVKNPYVLQASTGSFALMFTMGILTYMLPLKTESLGLTELSAGLMISTFGFVAIIIFVLPINKYYDRISSRQIMLTGMAIITIAVFCLSLVDQPRFIYLVMGLYGVGFAFMFPSMSSLLVEHVDEQDRGKAFGLFFALYSLGVVVGSFTIGVLAVTPDEGFRIGAAFIGLSVIMLILLGKRHKKTTS